MIGPLLFRRGPATMLLNFVLSRASVDAQRERVLHRRTIGAGQLLTIDGFETGPIQHIPHSSETDRVGVRVLYEASQTRHCGMHQVAHPFIGFSQRLGRATTVDVADALTGLCPFTTTRTASIVR